MTLRAVIFDCDGLLVDTETSALESWRGIFDRYDVPLTDTIWDGIIGRGVDSRLDLLGLIEATAGPIDRAAILAERDALHRAAIATLPLLPGVLDRLDECHALGLRVGLASSSEFAHVHSLLRQTGIHDRFDAIVCGDEVARTKPAPDLYLLALDRLGVTAAEAIAIEDSPGGAAAARVAGIRCVVVPNAITARMVFGPAHLRLASLVGWEIASLVSEEIGPP